MAAVAIRYAKAFADVVSGAKLDAAKVVAEVQSILATYQASADLRNVWSAPAIPAEEKRKLLDAILQQMGGVQRPVRNFLAVLIDHGRMGQFSEIVRQFELELNHRLGRIDAEIVSARPLSPAEQQTLVAQLVKTTGKQIAPHYATDSNLLGGVVVKVGSTVYDGSVRGQLQKIKEQLGAE